MKKILLLLTIVAFFTFGLLLIRERLRPSWRGGPTRGAGNTETAKPSPSPDKGGAGIRGKEAPPARPHRNNPAKKSKGYRGTRPIRPAPALLTWQQGHGELPLTGITAFTPAQILLAEKKRKRDRRQHGYAKSDLPDRYALFERQIRTREGETFPHYRADYKLRELSAARQLLATRPVRARSQVYPWSERGPANVPGRTRGLITHPAYPGRIWWAGSVAGGIWKTTDAGGNWVNKTPELPNLATTVLVLAPSNPDILYAGTGEGFYNVDAAQGDGIFKSNDGGETWHQLPATAGKQEFRNVNRLLVDPQNPDVLLACTNIGFYDFHQSTTVSSWIMRSADGGATWTPVLAYPRRIQQLVATPNNFRVLYGAVERVGVVKSTDGGKTWALSNKGMYPTGRVEMAIAPSNPTRLYAAAVGNLSSGVGGSDLYLSSDAGQSWTLTAEADNGANVDWLQGQGWYDNTLAVHPYNEDMVYLGGVDLWKMTMTPRSGTTPQQVVTGVEEVNTQGFLLWGDLGGPAFGGRLLTGNLPDADRASVEIRFGPGQSQRAHRFTVGGAIGVAPQNYQYRDYVEVPFTVWDLSHNRQLMVSFRDQQEDGGFNLLPAGGSAPAAGREYIFIHASAYDSLPLADIAQNGGQQYQNMYVLWPQLRPGATWEPTLLPAARLVITTGYLATRLRHTQVLTDYYGQYGGPNENVHPDHHNLVCIPELVQAQTFKILNANDGGVYVSQAGTDPGVAPGSWIFAGNGYNTTQFYGVDKKRGSDEYFGGSQDNGSWRSPTLEKASAATSYTFQIGGDGFEVSWNYYDPGKLIGSYYQNNFRRSLNGGETWSAATSGLSDLGPRAPFMTQVGTHPSNPDVLYTTGASGVWVSENFGENWRLSPIREGWAFNNIFGDVKVSGANTQVVWAGHALSSTGRIQVSTNGGQSFKATSGYEGATLGSISGLATHPTDDSTAYVLFSFPDTPKILKTTDLGQTWADISGFGKNAGSSSTGFPDVAVYTLLVMPHNPDILWAGTEIGLVESRDGGATWALAHNGLPAVSVWELKVVDDQVVVATHGRGIWSVTLPELYQPVVFVPYIREVRESLNRKINISASLRSAYDSTVVMANGLVARRLGKTAAADTVLQIRHGQEAVVAVQLRSYLAGKEYVSMIKTIEVLLAQPLYAYANDFNQASDDFFGTGFSIRSEPGFADGALHTAHPYQESQDYTCQLKAPVIIAEQNALIHFREVVITEPGEPGAEFGGPGFYDYVIVEGTRDGLQWKALQAGYNVNYNRNWRQAFNQGQPVTDSLLASHTLDLHQAFAAGDTVLLRFRLHSDYVFNAWGWAIDDLSIQQEFSVISAFTLVNAATGANLGPLVDQDSVNLSRTGRELNIRAQAMPDSVGSVVFQLNQAVFGIDSEAPYTLVQESGGHHQAWTPAPGTYTLTATPFSGAQGKGRPGKPLHLTFTVIKANEVASFVLVNAETGADIRPLLPGDVVDLQQVGRKLNIRAYTLPLLVGSVVFTFDGQARTENFFPYALGGFNYLRLRYQSWTPPVGTHTLKATPYTKFQGQGQAGRAHQLQFSVVDGPGGTPPGDDLAAGRLRGFPNPTQGKVSVDLPAREQQQVTIEVYNLKGVLVHRQQVSLFPGNGKVELDLSAFPDGMYLIKAVSNRQRFASFNIFKRQ